jgi:hypothetical protein
MYICEPIVWTMWDPQQATARYGDLFYLYLPLARLARCRYRRRQ